MFYIHKNLTKWLFEMLQLHIFLLNFECFIIHISSIKIKVVIFANDLFLPFKESYYEWFPGGWVLPYVGYFVCATVQGMVFKQFTLGKGI